MKIRNGFVSNSSSSSFLALMVEEDFKKFESGLDPIKSTILKYGDVSLRNLNGLKISTYHFVDGNDDYDLEYMDKDQFIEDVIALAKEQNIEVEFDDYICALKDEKSFRDQYIYHRSQIATVLGELEKDNKCIVLGEHW